MSPKTTITVLELDDDPLGGILVESEVTFGLRAATLAGNASGLTGAAGGELIPCHTVSCSVTFTPPDADQADRPAFDG
jgi:hypothetical protein